MSAKHLKKGDALPPSSPGKLRLYSMVFCPFAERTRLVLAAKNIPHETVNVNLTDKPEWLTEKNDQSKVPILEQDGKLIIESLLTSDYLDEAYPNNPLYPKDPYLKIKQRMLIEAFGPVVGLLFKPLYNKGLTPEELDANYKELYQKMERFENELKQSGKKFFNGDAPGMADYMMFPMFERIPFAAILVGTESAKFPSSKLPLLAAWTENMKNDKAVKQIIIPTEKHVEFFKLRQAGTPNYDIPL